MIKSSGFSTVMFRLVCLGFSALLLVMSLQQRARLVELEESISRLEKEIELEEKETQILKVKLENRISLAELESIALQRLGMQRPNSAQLCFEVLAG